MSRVRHLTEQPKRQPPTQCEVTVEEMGAEYSHFYSDYRKRRAAKRGFTPDQCGKQTKWLVDGRALCGFHAGIAALRILSD